jgi:TnpA family transposase
MVSSSDLAMISPTDTVYPVLPASPSATELTDAYTPDLFELKFAEERTREAAPRVALLALLKTFQRLGYFVKLADIPLSILRKVTQTAGYEAVPSGLDHYDQSTLRVRHMALVRSWTGVSAYDRAAFKIIVKSCVEASRVREDLADIINIAIEELLRKRYELPGFTTLLRAARSARATVNWSYYSRISQALDPQARTRIDALFEKADEAHQTSWDMVKTEPGQPTVKGVKRFLENARWLKEQTADPKALAGIPIVKLQRFAAEARVLNASRMKESQPDKRYAFALALIHRQRARALDDAADMLIRLVQRMQNAAKEKFLSLQTAYLQQSGDLAAKLRDVGLAYLSDGSETQRLQSIGSLLGPDVQELLRRCEECVGLAAGNHFRLLPKCFGHPRQALLALLENLPLCPTSQDRSVVDAVAFVLANQNGRTTKVPIADSDPLDLSFVSDAWWPLVTGLKARSTVSQIDRRLFELCVVTQVANDLKSGDLCIPEGDKFRDYRLQLLSWEEVERELASYSEQAGIAAGPKAFVAQLRNQLEERARATDKAFPDNRYLRFENGEPILTPVEAAPDPEGLDHSLSLIKERLEPIEILDAFADTEHWLNWTRHFGPISGLETKLKRVRERYLLTVFCYGCNLGPVQTARSVRGVNRFQLAFINQRHITEQFLNEAITTIVNAYVQFPLQSLWGTGQSASADGMKWNLYPQNLMSEYHIRYGGYGGIGYYLVADNYIALMSRWSTCGAWEGHAILDFLKENESDVKPDMIHADTQGQSNAIFGLAYLLGIQLLPRIRNWKGKDFYRPSPETRFEHIDSLFTAQVDWDLMETMRPELLRVAVSIKAGVILPSDILRRLGSYSRKNKLYFALRELGRVVRTMFLLRYISEAELRQAIQTATNKSERFNEFVQWISFGGDDVIAENIRDEQRKFIKYNHLVANILAFHNMVSMTKAIEKLKAQGQEISNEVLAAISPYQTSHINRFGQYQLQSRRVPEPLPLVRKPAKVETTVVSPGLAAGGSLH